MIVIAEFVTIREYRGATTILEHGEIFFKRYHFVVDVGPREVDCQRQIIELDDDLFGMLKLRTLVNRAWAKQQRKGFLFGHLVEKNHLRLGRRNVIASGDDDVTSETR